MTLLVTNSAAGALGRLEATLWPFTSVLLCGCPVPDKRMALFVPFGFVFSMSAACSISRLALRSYTLGKA